MVLVDSLDWNFRSWLCDLGSFQCGRLVRGSVRKISGKVLCFRLCRLLAILFDVRNSQIFRSFSVLQASGFVRLWCCWRGSPGVVCYWAMGDVVEGPRNSGFSGLPSLEFVLIECWGRVYEVGSLFAACV